MRPLALLLLLPVAAPAQAFHVGLAVGVPLTPYFDTGPYSLGLHGGGDYSAATRRYTVGAFAEWRPLDTLGLRAGALYHRMGYVARLNYFNSANGDYTNTAIDVKGNSWDFPLLLRRRFGRVVRPYVAGGGVLRYIGPVRGRGTLTVGSLVSRSSTTTPLDTTQPSELRKRFYPGLAAAGGVELGRGRFHLAPELRYTRWTANISGPEGALRFAPNQLDFLLALIF